MKKPALHVLEVVTLVFAAFTMGLLVGRSGGGGDVIVSVPAPMLTEPAATQPPTAPTDEQVQFPIDLNMATAQELAALPGIGEVLARRIVAYREANGPFTAPEDLMNIEDIGEKRVEDIVNLVKIGG